MSKFQLILEEKIKPSLFEEIDAKLDEESRKDFYEALYNEKISTKAIVDVLILFEIFVSKSTILRWRQMGMEEKTGTQ